jgi:diguanylate cyclase (GGDEF)-like protein
MNFKSLKTRIAVIFLTLILSIQIISSVVIQLSIEENARASVNEQLEIGERVFISLLKQNGENLSQEARILAADYGFRQAIASGDYLTILSALSNQQARVGADIALFYSVQNDTLDITGKLSSDVIKPSIIKLIAHAQENEKMRDYAIFDHHPYQLVAAPVKAPLTIGWVVMGFKINNSLAEQLNQLSNLEVTFLNKSADSDWITTASTLKMDSAEKLIRSSMVTLDSEVQNSEVIIGKTAYGMRYVPIFNDQDQSLYAVLERSIDDLKAPYERLQLTLIVLTILSVLVLAITILYLSKLITKPITDLAKVAKKLEDGNYDLAINSDRADELGNLSRSFGSMSAAISSREKSIRKLAYYDELTQLPNRASFILQLSKTLQAAEKSQSQLTILVLNLDRFKQINNILGHDAGDEMLRMVAARILASTMNPNDFVARIGGDQFALLLPETSPEQGLSFTTVLLKALESPILINQQSVDLNASIGIASYPDHAQSEAQLLTRAEMAMYRGKAISSGAAIFDKSYDLNNTTNLSLASELKVALAENQLQMYVQPKIDFASAKVSSLEALVRWKHPEKGYIFPDQFIPFAEQTGFIQQISLWMLNEAARNISLWQQQAVQIPIAINISTRDLIDQDLPNKIEAIFKSHHLDCNAIVLEITESSIMDDPVRALATLDKLAAMDIALSIDDFGTGYSSLTYLKRLPVSELKIDQSFIFKMAQDDSDKKIVQSTIDLGHNLGLKVVAEGVEDLLAWGLLRAMGCDFGQGYYMARPMPANDFIAWLAQWEQSEIYRNIMSQQQVEAESIKS